MNVYLISHIADPDGVTPLILLKLIYDKVDYSLLEVSEVNNAITNMIKMNIFDNYDIVYITDLGISEELCELINNNQTLRNKIKLFDHHICNMSANKYEYARVIDTNSDGVKESATSIFYKYLLNTYNNPVLKKESVNKFVDLVRQYDTWEWQKNNNIDSKNLSHLFDLYGNEYFIEKYYNFLKKNDFFSFDEKEIFLLDIEQRRISNYIERKKKEIISAKILDYKVGIVYATSYRSELGNSLAIFYQDIYDFIVIINIDHCISYRGIKDINLGEFASMFGGGGHFYASGSPVPKSIRTDVIKLIFKDKIVINDQTNY